MHLKKWSAAPRFSNEPSRCSMGCAQINPCYPVGRWSAAKRGTPPPPPQPFLVMVGWVGWGGGNRYITHVYRGSVFFTSIGQIRFVKTLLRLTYEAVVNGNRISVIGHPIIPPVQTRGEQRAEGLRRTPGTERSCGSSKSVAFSKG